MLQRIALCLCLLGGCLAAPARAATATQKASARGAAPTVAGGPSVARKDTTTAPAPTVAAPRRLEDIHIEGEIPAPQVLFVTARDQRRLTKFHHDRYLKTSVQVGEGTPLPTRIALTSRPTTPAGAP